MCLNCFGINKTNVFFYQWLQIKKTQAVNLNQSTTNLIKTAHPKKNTHPKKKRKQSTKIKIQQFTLKTLIKIAHKKNTAARDIEKMDAELAAIDKKYAELKKLYGGTNDLINMLDEYDLSRLCFKLCENKFHLQMICEIQNDTEMKNTIKNNYNLSESDALALHRACQWFRNKQHNITQGLLETDLHCSSDPY